MTNYLHGKGPKFMAWYYVLDGTSRGPVAETVLRSLHKQNIVVFDTPVWTEGMAEWVPFQDSTLFSGASAGRPAVTHTCVECGRLFPESEMLRYDQAWVCAACKPVFFQRVKEGVTPKGNLIFASVGRRFVAIMADGLIIGLIFMVPVVVFFMGAATTMKPEEKLHDAPGWFTIAIPLLCCLPPLYEIIFIGKYGATLGKMMMKIKVVGPDGAPISYGRSTGRYFAKILSGIILYIGFLMAIWDEEKRALHDRICQTRVIK